RGTGKVAAAIGRACGGGTVLAQLLALRMIGEATRNLVFGVERKQQRQAARMRRIDVLLLAAMPPDPAQAFIVLAVLAQHDGGHVMQEAAEGLAAEGLILAGVEDEFVPEVVGDLRRP